MATVKLAQCDNGKGLTRNETLLIANGAPINKVIAGKQRLYEFMKMLNTELQRAGISPIEPEGSIKGRILDNKEYDGRLVLSDVWESEKEVYPARTGTLVAYNKKDAKLGDVVKYTDSGTTYIFEVPKEYQNEKNAILVVNHGFRADGNALILPNEKGKEITYDITDKSQIALLQKFPSSNGWYLADKSVYNQNQKFGIPLLPKTSSDNPDARYLYRIQNYVGLLTRGTNVLDIDFNRWDVGANGQPSLRFGVLISTEGAKAGAQQ